MVEREVGYDEIKQIVEDYIKKIKGIDGIIIVFAKQIDGYWKVVVRYPTQDNPDTLSMLMINKQNKNVDYFREGINSF